MRKALVFAAILSVSGCIAPITPMERLQQSANDVASALRFDRTDLVAEYCAPKARDAFLERHAVWTDKTRIVDLELSGIYLRSQDEAEAMRWIGRAAATAQVAARQGPAGHPQAPAVGHSLHR